jgi:diguanylate cyclase (GGDEF)-like protein
MSLARLGADLGSRLGDLAGPAALWRTLKGDLVVRAAGLLSLAALAPLIFPNFPPQALETYRHFADVALVLIAIAAFQFRLRDGADAASLRFWNLWTAAFALGLAVSVFDIAAGRPLGGQLAADVVRNLLFAGFYIFIAIALELEPDSGRDVHGGVSARQLQAAGTICLISGLLIYFAVIPRVLARGAYETAIPVALLRLLPDGYLMLRLVGLRRASANPLWRGTNSWLLAMATLWAVADAVEALSWGGILSGQLVQGLLDLAWLPPFGAVIVAARLREHPFDAALPSAHEAATTADADPPFPGGLLLVQAAALPLIHIGLSSFKVLDPLTGPAQQVCAFAVFVVVGGIAFAYQKRLEAETRQREGARLGAALAEHRAFHDALTGLPNRYLLLDHLRLALAQARRDQRKAAVLILDLDRFKLINDSLGHTVGDQLLQAVAARLQDSLREADSLARLGGDELAVLIQGMQAGSDAATVARKLLDCVRRPFLLRGREHFVTASIGASLYPDDASDAETLVKNADAALYRAKELGGDCCQLFNAAMNQEASERLALENALRRAVPGNQFVLYYQPLLDVTTGSVDGCEAQLRWQHPESGLLAPGAFMERAELTGVITRLTPWILWTACLQVKVWQSRFGRPLSIAVNLSSRQFQDPDLVRYVDEALREAELDPRLLELEITESLAMENAEHTVQILRQLKDLGVWISIDDFGTGYSSLSYLKAFPIDTLKIDKSFVRDIDTDPADAAIAATVMAIARTLRLKVVAEGVEREQQLHILRERDCDRAQGYLFGRPMPAEDFAAFLGAHGNKSQGEAAQVRTATPAAT